MDPDPEPEPIEESIPRSAPTRARHTRKISLEFDPAATDVSDIFISPSESEHDTASGDYEAVVLSEENPSRRMRKSKRDPEPAESKSRRRTRTPSPPTTGRCSTIRRRKKNPFPTSSRPRMRAPKKPRRPPIRPGSTKCLPKPRPKLTGSHCGTEAAAESRPPRVPVDTEARATSDAAQCPADPRAADAPGLAVHQRGHRLALLLVAQIVHYNRRSLVLTPTLGPTTRIMADSASRSCRAGTSRPTP